LFNLYLILRAASEAAFEKVLLIENKEVTIVDPALSFLQDVLPEKESTFRGPCPYHNYFNHHRGIVLSDGAVAFHVTDCPDHTGLAIIRMQDLWGLPDLLWALHNYIYVASNGSHIGDLDIHSKVTVWNKFQIQLRSSFRSNIINCSQVVQAFPPSDSHPLEHCDAVLLSRPGSGDLFGKPHPLSLLPQSDFCQDNILPAYLNLVVPLLYVRYFHIMLPPANTSMCLYQVERINPSESHASGIVLLTDVILAIDLVPIFSSALPGVASCSETCLEGYSDYYINSFTDKDSFHVLH
ncbi:hypothetical protein L210DRAFT_3414481, partial [Boletus edulis BED1]